MHANLNAMHAGFLFQGMPSFADELPGWLLLEQ